MTWLDWIAKISSVLLTPLLGIIGTWILINQYRLLHSRWRLDLYDKRYPVFLTTMEFLAKISSSGTITSQAALDFLHNTKSFEFLFDHDVREHLDNVYKKALKLATIDEELPSRPVDEQRTELVNQKAEILKWVYNQFDVTSEVFGRYLRIHKK